VVTSAVVGGALDVISTEVVKSAKINGKLPKILSLQIFTQRVASAEYSSQLYFPHVLSDEKYRKAAMT